MSPLMLKILMIGIPIVVALSGIGLIVWLIVTSAKESKNAKATVSGLLFIHPDNGGGYKLIDKDKTLKRPTLRPIWYKPHWYSGEKPFWFFFEDKAEAAVQVVEQVLKCSCGYSATGKPQLQAHTMWNPRRWVDGKPILKEDWAKIHSKVETEKKPVAESLTAYVIKPYDIDANKSKGDVIITPFGVYDINNWECQKSFLTVRQTGWEKGLQLGAGVIMAVACLIGIIALGGELGKKAEPVKAAPAAMQINIGER